MPLNQDVEYFAFAVHGASQIHLLAAGTHENFVDVPTTKGYRTAFADPASIGLSEFQHPQTNRLLADVDTAFVTQILNLPMRQREADIHHCGKADDLGRSFEITEWISHPQTLRNVSRRLKPVYSDTAVQCAQSADSWQARLLQPTDCSLEYALSASVMDAKNMAAHNTGFNEAGGHAMSHEVKDFLQNIVDNVFWLFLLLMIVLGTVLDTPFVNVGLTAR